MLLFACATATAQIHNHRLPWRSSSSVNGIPVGGALALGLHVFGAHDDLDQNVFAARCLLLPRRLYVFAFHNGLAMGQLVRHPPAWKYHAADARLFGRAFHEEPENLSPTCSLTEESIFVTCPSRSKMFR